MIQPRNDRLLIERLEGPQKGLIIAPQVAQERSIRGRVIAVGPKVECVKPGDLVLFNSRWNDVGENFERPDYRFDERLHLVQEADVFGIINA